MLEAGTYVVYPRLAYIHMSMPLRVLPIALSAILSIFVCLVFSCISAFLFGPALFTAATTVQNCSIDVYTCACFCLVVNLYYKYAEALYYQYKGEPEFSAY